MLIYTGTKQQFDKDVLSNMIAPKIEREFANRDLSHNNRAEFVSWENSMREMQKVLDSTDFSDDIQIAVEYQIPLTSKRVDFIIAGADSCNKEHLIIVELKQWEEANKTNTNGIVTAFTGGSVKAVAHPSYQAYTYAKMIENFNATIQEDAIGIHPCAYLHNYRASAYGEITAPIYREVLDLAPLYIKSEEEKFCEFIKNMLLRAQILIYLIKLITAELSLLKLCRIQLSV